MSTAINKKFPHKKFLLENKDIIATHPVPDMLKKRILGFEELEEDLEHTEDEDKEELINRMEDLSLELDEDLEEFYEDLLENNDSQEEEPEPKASLAAPAPEPKMQKPEVALAPVKETPKPNFTPQSNPVIKNTDESILENLLKAKTSTIMPDKLLALGFKTPLGAKSIQVGHYLLYKAKYALYYSIIKNS